MSRRLRRPEGLLPHRPPMVLLDGVLEAGDDFLIGEVRIEQGIPFFADGLGVPAWVGIEYMGQAIAALAGLRAERAGEPVGSGLLVGCRRYKSAVAAFAPGRRLEVEVRDAGGSARPFCAFDGLIRDGEVLVRSSISVYLRPAAA
jgi:predicted hotdog family 3-hydroxylacyl-ACP dehydratase